MKKIRQGSNSVPINPQLDENNLKGSVKRNKLGLAMHAAQELAKLELEEVEVARQAAHTKVTAKRAHLEAKQKLPQTALALEKGLGS